MVMVKKKLKRDPAEETNRFNHVLRVTEKS